MARPEHASCRAESWRACGAGSCSPELQRSRSLHPGNTVLRWRPGKSVERRDQGRGRGGERGGGTRGEGAGEERRQKGHTEELKREKERQGMKTPGGCQSGAGVGGCEDQAVGTVRQQAGDKGARRGGKTRQGQVPSCLWVVPTADKGPRFFLCVWVMRCWGHIPEGTHYSAGPSL